MFQSSQLAGKKVLITGGLGFIGSNLAQAFVASRSSVVLLDACLDPYGWNHVNIAEIKDRVSIVKGDIRDAALMKTLVAGQDVIIDCAAQVSHTISVRDPMLDVQINCEGALTVLDSVRKHAPGARILYCSTRGVIGRMAYSPIDEVHPLAPLDFNGVDKMAAEYYHRLYRRLHGIRSTVLRVNNTYGPRSQMKTDDYGIVNWLVRRALLNEDIVIHGDGSQTRDYNYIDDVVDAFLRAAVSDKASGEVFMLGSGTETRLIDVIDLIRKISKSTSRVILIPRPQERRQIEIGNFKVSIRRIKEVLGWEPRIGLENGLRETIGFYRVHIKEYL